MWSLMDFFLVAMMFMALVAVIFVSSKGNKETETEENLIDIEIEKIEETDNPFPLLFSDDDDEDDEDPELFQFFHDANSE